MTTTLKWKKSEVSGWSASRGDVMFWGRDELFAEATTAWVAFRAARNGSDWELRVWTCDHLTPAVTTLRTLGQAKEAAAIIAEAIANRFDGKNPAWRDLWMVKSFVEDAGHAAEMWVSWPDQRDQDDVARLAKVGVEAAL